MSGLEASDKMCELADKALISFIKVRSPNSSQNILKLQVFRNVGPDLKCYDVYDVTNLIQKKSKPAIIVPPR